MRSTEERKIQIACVAWWYLQFPRRLGNPMLYAIPNGGSRNVREAASLKREGVLAGATDLELVLPKGKTVRVEVKIPEKVIHGFSKKTGKPTKRTRPAGKLSEEQVFFHDNLRALGHTVYVVYSLDEFREVVKREMV